MRLSNTLSDDLNLPKNEFSKLPVEDIPSDAILAKNARLAAETRGFFWVKEFASAIGRAPQFVSDRCRARVIRTMLGGRPYRIPYAEYGVWMNNREAKPQSRYLT